MEVFSLSSGLLTGKEGVMAKKSDEQMNPLEKLMERLKNASGEGGSPQKDSSQRKVHFSFWYFMLALLLISWLQGYMAEPQRERVPYSQFKQWVREGRVENVVLGPEKIRGEVKSDKESEKEKVKHFVTVRVEDPELVGLLDQHSIEYSGLTENKWIAVILSWLMPLAIFVLFWSYLIRRMSGGPQGVLSVGKARVKIFAEKEIGITFDDVAGIDEAKQELQEIVQFFKTPEKFQRLGACSAAA